MANGGMLHLEVEVVGEKQLSRVLDGIDSDIKDLRPAWEQIHKVFLEKRHGVFAMEGAFEGLPAWAPLSPKYAEWKESRYPGQPILVLTGQLRASLTDPNDPNHFYEATERELTMGSTRRENGWNLGLLHQRGTSRMPARPPATLTQPEKSRYVGVLHEYLWEDRIPWWIEREMKELDREFRRKVSK